jgi:hypothetical protein
VTSTPHATAATRSGGQLASGRPAVALQRDPVL